MKKISKSKHHESNMDNGRYPSHLPLMICFDIALSRIPANSALFPVSMRPTLRLVGDNTFGLGLVSTESEQLELNQPSIRCTRERICSHPASSIPMVRQQACPGLPPTFKEVFMKP